MSKVNLLFKVVIMTLCFPFIVNASDARIVWSARHNQGFDLFEVILVNGMWQKENCIVKGPDADLTPAVTESIDGAIWLVWITRNVKGEASLHYMVRRANQITLSGVIDTKNSEIYSPTILIDSKKFIWVSWSGVDDRDEDIYASYFNGVTWSKILRVNNDNTRPDIRPVLSLNVNGLVEIFWSSLDKEGYRIYRSRWNRVQFDKEELVQEEDSPWNLDKNVCASLPPLPKVAAERVGAVIFHSTQTGVQSLPEWIAPCNTRSLQ